jgi:phosphopantetheinyl transferase
MPTSVIDVYQIPLQLEDQQLQRLRPWLLPTELAKADRFVVDSPRQQFVGCRVALRCLLAHRLDCTPHQVAISYSTLGKPELAAPPGEQKCGLRSEAYSEGRAMLYFNVSHSGTWGLVAIASEPVGIDLEAIHPRIHVRSLVSTLLSPAERSAWREIRPAEQLQQIVRLWVCKEALLKAMGLGIAECLQMVNFPLPLPTTESFGPLGLDGKIQLHLNEQPNCALNAWLLTNHWQLRPIAVADEYYAALAHYAPPSISPATINHHLWDWTKF